MFFLIDSFAELKLYQLLGEEMKQIIYFQEQL